MKAEICICVFPVQDGRTVKERLMEAAENYRELTGQQEKAEQVTGLDLFAVARTKYGKPYFPNQPGLHFSISHSGAYWACAFFEAPVGLDIQVHSRKEGESFRDAAARYGRMAVRFFHPEEAEYVQKDSYGRFFRIWAARESYVKYTGRGIDKEFGKLCVLPGTAEAGAGGRDFWKEVRQFYR